MTFGYAYQVDLWHPDTSQWLPDGPQAASLTGRTQATPDEVARRILRTWTEDYPPGARARVTVWAQELGARTGPPLAVVAS